MFLSKLLIKSYSLLVTTKQNKSHSKVKYILFVVSFIIIFLVCLIKFTLLLFFLAIIPHLFLKFSSYIHLSHFQIKYTSFLRFSLNFFKFPYTSSFDKLTSQHYFIKKVIHSKHLKLLQVRSSKKK